MEIKLAGAQRGGPRSGPWACGPSGARQLVGLSAQRAITFSCTYHAPAAPATAPTAGGVAGVSTTRGLGLRVLPRCAVEPQLAVPQVWGQSGRRVAVPSSRRHAAARIPPHAVRGPSRSRRVGAEHRRYSQRSVSSG